MAIVGGAKACDLECGAASSVDHSAVLLGSVRLPARIEFVSDARQFVRKTLEGGQAVSRMVDDAELLASELVTNAARHCIQDVESETMLNLSRIGRRLRIEVYDSDSSAPVQRSPGGDAESGRGLTVVESLADRWGHVATPGGKCVWFELTAWSAEPTVQMP